MAIQVCQHAAEPRQGVAVETPAAVPRGERVTGEPAGLAWPSSPPPPAFDGWHWELTSVAELPRVRAQLRRGLAAESGGSPAAEELDEAVVLAFDEMASNALRHGG